MQYSLHPLLIAIFQNFKCLKMIYLLLAWIVTINNTRNDEFLVKILEDQQKVYIAFMRLISILDFLDHYAI